MQSMCKDCWQGLHLCQGMLVMQYAKHTVALHVTLLVSHWAYEV